MTQPSLTRHPELVSGSIYPQAWSERLKAPRSRQIVPAGVLALNQIDLPLASPVLKLLLTRNGRLHGVEHFKADEAVDFVPAGKAGRGSASVLMQSAHKVRRDANIERAVMPAGEEIDARVALRLHSSDNADGWMLKQVQHDDREWA